MIRIKIVLIFILFVTSTAFSSEIHRLYLDGIKNYESGEYVKAVEVFEKIADEGIRNGELFYNLGNAHFKAGDIGNSIAWYERALRMIPNDPDLNFNYQYVEGFVKDKSDDKDFSVVKVLFFWKEIFGKTTIKWLAVSFFALFCVLIVFQIVKNRKLIKIHTGLIFTIAFIFILTALYDYYEQNFIEKAVILPAKVSVRSGLSDDSTELFILHVGTRVTIEDRRKGYVKIRFAGEKIGWIIKEHVEII